MQGFLGAGKHFARWFEIMPPEITGHIELDIPGVPESGGSDHMSFICKPAPGFRLQSNYPDYRQYTWHTNRDTFDKIVFDDLRNNATLAAMLVYAASEDPERMGVTQRVMPVNARTGQPGPWPGCRAAEEECGRVGVCDLRSSAAPIHRSSQALKPPPTSRARRRPRGARGFRER